MNGLFGCEHYPKAVQKVWIGRDQRVRCSLYNDNSAKGCRGNRANSSKVTVYYGIKVLHTVEASKLVVKSWGVLWAWWHMVVIPDLVRLRQEDHTFKLCLANLVISETLSSKKGEGEVWGSLMQRPWVQSPVWKKMCYCNLQGNH